MTHKTHTLMLDFCKRDHEETSFGRTQSTSQPGMDRCTNPEVVFESALNVEKLNCEPPVADIFLDKSERNAITLTRKDHDKKIVSSLDYTRQGLTPREEDVYKPFWHIACFPFCA